MLLGLALAALGLTLMTVRTRDKFLDTERRYGPEWQRRAADTPRRRKQVRAFSVALGLFFIAGGFVAVFGNG